MSEVAGAKIDEAFIGSGMTNIGHFRASAKLLGGSRSIPVKLWVAPPTKMDESELIKEGHYGAFGTAGAGTEMADCSCAWAIKHKGGKAQPSSAPAPLISPTDWVKTPTCFWPRPSLLLLTSKLGKIPTVTEYQEVMGIVNKDGTEIYKYLNFDQLEEYVKKSKTATA